VCVHRSWSHHDAGISKGANCLKLFGIVTVHIWKSDYISTVDQTISWLHCVLSLPFWLSAWHSLPASPLKRKRQRMK
ncbi:MAG: hypothetical protein ACPG3W_11695, partial [Synechococcus sp.]